MATSLLLWRFHFSAGQDISQVSIDTISALAAKTHGAQVGHSLCAVTNRCPWLLIELYLFRGTFGGRDLSDGEGRAHQRWYGTSHLAGRTATQTEGTWTLEVLSEIE